MASQFVARVMQTVTATTAAGYATVTDTSGLWPGAVCWLRGASGSPAAVAVVVADIASATSVGLRFVSQGGVGRSDISAYTTGSLLTQPEQVVGGVRDDLDRIGVEEVAASVGDLSLVKYIIKVADASVPNAQATGSLATGIVKNTTTSGTLSIAVANTDYAHPDSTYIVKTALNAPAGAQVLASLSTGLVKVTTTTGALTTAAANTDFPHVGATYIVQTASNAPGSAQVLASLATGLVKVTTTTGVLSAAAANTDFPHVSATYVVNTATNAPPGAQSLAALSTGLVKVTTTTGALTTASSSTDYAHPSATYIVKTTTNAPTNAQAMGSLATGIVKNTTTTGVQSIASADTDIVVPTDQGTIPHDWIVRSRLNFTWTNPVDFHDPFMVGIRNWTDISATGGTISRAAADAHAVLLSSTANSSGQGDIVLGNYGAASASLSFRGTSSAKFYIRLRFKFTTTMDNVARMGLVIGSAVFGFRGPTSSTNFACLFDAGASPTLISTIAIDTSFHTMEVWGNGTSAWFSIDAETPITSAAANVSADSTIVLAARNSGTAANRAMVVDNFFIRQERA